MTRFAPALARRGYRLGRGRGRSHVALVLIGLAMAGAMVLPFPRRMHGSTQRDVAEFTVKKYAWEAFPQWAQANPSRICPDRLRELDAWMTSKDAIDPWGTEYRWTCTTRLVVWSAGPDVTFGTDDDVGSGQ